MKKLLLLTVIALVTCVGAMAQAPEIQWQKSFGGSNYDEASYVQLTTDGGYIVAVYSESDDGDVTGHHGGFDYWIVKLDASGTIEWQKSLGGSNGDGVSSIQQTTDGGYIVAGNSSSNDGDVTGHHGSNDDNDYWIVKLDASGAIAWQKSLGGSDYEYVSSIQQTTDGGYIVAGNSSSNDGDVTGHHGGGDMWIVKLGGATGIHDMEYDASALFSLYPNPNNGRFIIEGPASGRGNYNLSISNVLGQKVYSQTEQVNEDKLRVEIATGELAPGVYFLNVSKEGKSVAVKQFVLKSEL